jgi:hypothetical protein
MNVKPVKMRCSQLDRLGHDLIDAYRALEDRKVLASVHATEPPGNDISVIRKAMEQHRRSCPICTPKSVNGQQVTRTMYFLR